MKEHKNQHLMLKLILTQGKGMTVGKIMASNKQEVYTPINFHDMAEQLIMFTTANDIYLNKLSVGSQCLRLLQTMIDCNTPTFRARECLDKEFPVQILPCSQLTLPKRAQTVQDCNKPQQCYNMIIDFSQLVSQVLFGSFHISLPPTYSMKTSEAPTTTGNNDSNNVRANKENRCKIKRGSQ
jgi:hypothetical protein